MVTIWNLFCGFLVPRVSIPTAWIWLYWLSPIRYALEALSVSQLYCSDSDITCPQITYIVDGQPVTSSQWQYVKTSYGFEYNNRWTDCAAILAFLAFFRIGGFLGLRYVKHITR